MQVDFDAPGARRAVSLSAVAGIHILIIAVLLTQSASVRAILPRITPARLLPDAAPRPPPPPPVRPVLTLPGNFVPLPDFSVAPPPDRAAVARAITRAPPTAPQALHFGAASGDAGLGLSIAAVAGGGAAARGSLADFEAAVKRRVLAEKHQPSLAWDRRDTCVVNYTVTISPGGGLAGLSIDPCAVPEINAAARTAIRNAAPFPAPPDLGAPTTSVHGSLIFRP